jgi:hypothetical protein
MDNLFEVSQTGITSATGTVTLDAKRSTWYNQLVISRGNATTGTLTLKYTVNGTTFTLKDAEGDAITLSLATQPDPVKFEGLIDTLVIEQADNNGTFSALLVGI